MPQNPVHSAIFCPASLLFPELRGGRLVMDSADNSRLLDEWKTNAGLYTAELLQTCLYLAALLLPPRMSDLLLLLLLPLLEISLSVALLLMHLLLFFSLLFPSVLPFAFVHPSLSCFSIFRPVLFFSFLCVCFSMFWFVWFVQRVLALLCLRVVFAF